MLREIMCGLLMDLPFPRLRRCRDRRPVSLAASAKDAVGAGPEVEVGAQVAQGPLHGLGTGS